MSEKPILIGSDHAGYELKEKVKEYLQKKGIPFIDLGADHLDPQDDYPVYSSRVAVRISKGEYDRGIIFCGTGIGASIAANRFRKVRAALCATPQMAAMSRQHNDSNILVLGGRTTEPETAFAAIDAWLTTPFEGGRHAKRTDLLDNF